MNLGYPPYRADMQNPRTQTIVRTIESAVNGPVIQVVSLGQDVLV
jgi:hypothetical protein